MMFMANGNNKKKMMFLLFILASCDPIRPIDGAARVFEIKGENKTMFGHILHSLFNEEGLRVHIILMKNNEFIFVGLWQLASYEMLKEIIDDNFVYVPCYILKGPLLVEFDAIIIGTRNEEVVNLDGFIAIKTLQNDFIDDDDDDEF